jgi:hypothetical protein
MGLPDIDSALDTYLRALAGDAPAAEFLEIRRRAAQHGMISEFHSVGERDAVAHAVLGHARTTDVYVGCAPRVRQSGTKDAIRRVWTLWVECDGSGAVDALMRFDPGPAIVIGSGSGVNCHAYWPLSEPLTPPAAEAANLRLAVAVGADLACFDASRILRPPGTWNHKHRPPTPVVALRVEGGRTFAAADVLRRAPRVEDERIARRWQPPPERRHRDDPLLRIPPFVYVTDLLGRPPGRDHKVVCPFHEDRRPSLHVFRTPERGWCCFSCGRGGSIYDLAADVWGMTPRGREFIELRRRLTERFADELERARTAYQLERA